MSAARFLGSLLLASLITAGCERPTTPTPTPDGTTKPQPQQQVVGCQRFASAAGQPMCGVLQSFGHPAADQVFGGEVSLQRAFWSGISVRAVSPLNDCNYENRNALADPTTREIYFGTNLFSGLIAQHGNVLPVAGVLAHEWGHQIQFQFGWQTNPARGMELEADAFSGYFMALAKGWAWPYMNSYFQTVFDTGDYNFNSAGHHGTPAERHAMARVGFDTAVQAATNGRALSYVELHGIFSSALFRLRGFASESMLSAELARIAETVASGEAQAVLRGAAGRPDVMPGDDAARRQLWPR